MGNASQEKLETNSSALDKEVLIGPDGLLLGEGRDVAAGPSSEQDLS